MTPRYSALQVNSRKCRPLLRRQLFNAREMKIIFFSKRGRQNPCMLTIGGALNGKKHKTLTMTITRKMKIDHLLCFLVVCNSGHIVNKFVPPICTVLLQIWTLLSAKQRWRILLKWGKQNSPRFCRRTLKKFFPSPVLNFLCIVRFLRGHEAISLPDLPHGVVGRTKEGN